MNLSLVLKRAQIRHINMSDARNNRDIKCNLLFEYWGKWPGENSYLLVDQRLEHIFHDCCLGIFAV